MSVATYVTVQFLRMLPRAQISHAVGQLAEWPWFPALGRAVVGVYSRAYDVALGECDKTGDWSSFDEFFTRPLRRGARTIDGDAFTLVSPADGKLVSESAIEAGGTFFVKGRPYSVGELLGSADEAARYVGGQGFVVYLSPRDYHRVHAPVAGTIQRIRSIPGDYFPVNDVGMRHVPSLFCRNRRVCIEIDGDGGAGRVAVVMVAAMIVGRITTRGISARDVPPGEHRLAPPLRVEKGEEIGVFHLGSTAVVLVEGGRRSEWVAAEGDVRLGEAVLRAQANDGAGALPRHAEEARP
jgi:phosphatidylserine decarboxylase